MRTAVALTTSRDEHGQDWLLLLAGPDGWMLPSGPVDPDDGPIWAAIGALREQAGLELEVGRGRFEELPAHATVTPVHLALGQGWSPGRPAVPGGAWAPAWSWQALTDWAGRNGVTAAEHGEVLRHLLAT